MRQVLVRLGIGLLVIAGLLLAVVGVYYVLASYPAASAAAAFGAVLYIAYFIGDAVKHRL